jgi:hypothetical protein
MTKDEVIAIAKRVAAEEGWLWKEPILVQKTHRYIFFGPVTWHVTSNAECRGCNVRVHVDDRSAEVTYKGFAPR